MLLLQTRLRLWPLVSFLHFAFVSFRARSRLTFVFFISASSPYRSCRYHLCFTLTWHLVYCFFFVPCVRTLICSTRLCDSCRSQVCASFILRLACVCVTGCICHNFILNGGLRFSSVWHTNLFSSVFLNACACTTGLCDGCRSPVCRICPVVSVWPIYFLFLRVYDLH